jgi:hypothetical protein
VLDVVSRCLFLWWICGEREAGNGHKSTPQKIPLFEFIFGWTDWEKPVPVMARSKTGPSLFG